VAQVSSPVRGQAGAPAPPSVENFSEAENCM
jgi:hypothetical protein